MVLVVGVAVSADCVASPIFLAYSMEEEKDVVVGG